MRLTITVFRSKTSIYDAIYIFFKPQRNIAQTIILGRNPLYIKSILKYSQFIMFFQESKKRLGYNCMLQDKKKLSPVCVLLSFSHY